MEFNEIRTPDVIELASTDKTSLTEGLDRYRDPQTGLAGIDIVIRPYRDDIFSIFGDVYFYFQKKQFIAQVGLDV